MHSTLFLFPLQYYIQGGGQGGGGDDEEGGDGQWEHPEEAGQGGGGEEDEEPRGLYSSLLPFSAPSKSFLSCCICSSCI